MITDRPRAIPLFSFLLAAKCSSSEDEGGDDDDDGDEYGDDDVDSSASAAPRSSASHGAAPAVLRSVDVTVAGRDLTIVRRADGSYFARTRRAPEAEDVDRVEEADRAAESGGALAAPPPPSRRLTVVPSSAGYPARATPEGSSATDDGLGEEDNEDYEVIKLFGSALYVRLTGGGQRGPSNPAAAAAAASDDNSPETRAREKIRAALAGEVEY